MVGGSQVVVVSSTCALIVFKSTKIKSRCSAVRKRARLRSMYHGAHMPDGCEWVLTAGMVKSRWLLQSHQLATANEVTCSRLRFVPGTSDPVPAYLSTAIHVGHHL
jgi:hypothetical protein